MDKEVIIVGGGMVGAALACGLAQADFQVLLLERQQPQEDWSSDQYDLRVSAITQASKHIFQNLGAWQGMLARRATPYDEMQVWDATGSGHIHFSAADVGATELGHIIENRIIQRGLWDVLEASDNVQVLCSTQIAKLNLNEEQPQIISAEGDVLQAKLLVAADGANSLMRELAGIDSGGWSYQQTALVATVKAELGHQNTAWQKFMPEGPLALLPTGKDLFSIVWSVSPEQADELLALSADDFSNALTEASEQRLGRLSLLAERRTFPLKLQHAKTYIGSGLALIGDAAHVIHPLAGQGVNLGLLDAMQLLDVLVAAKAKGRVLGSKANLRRYERTRMVDNVLMQGAMDGFKRLFSNDVAALRMLRNLGMTAADRVDPLKKLLMKQAMGTSGELPELAKYRW